jgi:hypothetical protein
VSFLSTLFAVAYIALLHFHLTKIMGHTMNAMTFPENFMKVSEIVKMPPNFDVLADSSAEDSLRKTSKIIRKYSTTYLGELAAVGIRDIFIRAQSETTAWRDPSVAALTPLLIPAVGMPLVGFAASFGIDYAVFGGAAKDLPLSFLFGVGSVVFGTSLGFVDKKWKGVVLSGLVVASSVAAFVGADASKYRAHITTPLYAAFGKSSAGTQTASDMAKSDYDAAALHLKADHDEFTYHDAKIPGTNKPLTMLNDGFTDNDPRGHALEDTIIPADQRDMDTKYVIWQNAQAKVPTAEARDPIELAGRGVVAASLAAWLVVSQIFVASVIEKMPGQLTHFSQKAMIRREQRKFLKDMQEPDPEVRRNKIAAAVKDMLVKRFAVVLTEAAAGDPERVANVEKLFGQESLDEMVRIGVDTVYKANGGSLSPSALPAIEPAPLAAPPAVGTVHLADSDGAAHAELFEAGPFADMVRTGVDTVDKSVDPAKPVPTTVQLVPADFVEPAEAPAPAAELGSEREPLKPDRSVEAQPVRANSVKPAEAPVPVAELGSEPEPLTVERFVEEQLAGKDQQDPEHMQFYINNAGEIEDKLKERKRGFEEPVTEAGSGDTKERTGPEEPVAILDESPIGQVVERGDPNAADEGTIQIPSRPGQILRIEITSDPDNNLKMTHDLKRPGGDAPSPAPAP